jgi:RsiW-degrading membrane proteinase PrsW (M82 family)
MVVMMEEYLLICFAFLPPIIYSIWIRNAEKVAREKWWPIFICFFWGATIAIIASLILEGLLHIPISLTFSDTSIIGLTIAILIAPVVEEFTKPLALRLKTVKHELDELEDGLIYGAVAGLGFSATENLFYGVGFLTEGIVFFIIMMSIRSFGACLLHAAATAFTGYGYGKMIIKKTYFARVIPYFLIAIGMHALYNFLVSFSLIGAGLGFLAAMILVVISIQWVRKKIRVLDAQF